MLQEPRRKVSKINKIITNAPFASVIHAHLNTIATWEHQMGAIIIRPDGEPFERKELTDACAYEVKANKALRPLKAAGLDLDRLRATAVVRLRRVGASEGEISAMVGTSVPMVRRYCRLADQRENAIAAGVPPGQNKGGTRRQNKKKISGLSA